MEQEVLDYDAPADDQLQLDQDLEPDVQDEEEELQQEEMQQDAPDADAAVTEADAAATEADVAVTEANGSPSKHAEGAMDEDGGGGGGEAPAGKQGGTADTVDAKDNGAAGGGAGGAGADASVAGPDPMSMPPHGTEVFMSKIPREATGAQVQEFCEQFGHKVHSIRLPKDPGSPGQNKGYAFVLYVDKEGAMEALLKLNQAELPDFPGRKITIVKSDVKNKLFIGGMPRALTREQISDAIKAEVAGVVDVSLMVEREAPNGNRGFGFIEFYNNAAAEAARKKMSRPDFKVHESQHHPLTVMWAEPKRNETASEQVKSVYVGNVPNTADEQKVRSIFSAYGKINAVVLKFSEDAADPAKVRNFAFVHYEDRVSALKAVDEATEGTTKPEIDGKLLTVQMARPPPQREDPDPRHAGGYGARGAPPLHGPPRGGYPPMDRYGDRGHPGDRHGDRGPLDRYGDRGGYGDRHGGPPPPLRGPEPRRYDGRDGRGPPYGGGGRELDRRPGALGPDRGRGGRGGYDDGYGEDGGYGGGEYGGDEADYGYGAFGGFGGMTMVPVMLPGGQMAFAMAPGPSVPGGRPPEAHAPPPAPPPARRRIPDGPASGSDARGAAYGAAARGAAYGSPSAGRDRDRDRDRDHDVRDARDGRDGRDARDARDVRDGSGARGAAYASTGSGSSRASAGYGGSSSRGEGGAGERSSSGAGSDRGGSRSERGSDARGSGYRGSRYAPY